MYMHFHLFLSHVVCGWNVLSTSHRVALIGSTQVQSSIYVKRSDDPVRGVHDVWVFTQCHLYLLFTSINPSLNIGYYSHQLTLSWPLVTTHFQSLQLTLLCPLFSCQDVVFFLPASKTLIREKRWQTMKWSTQFFLLIV